MTKVINLNKKHWIEEELERDLIGCDIHVQHSKYSTEDKAWTVRVTRKSDGQDNLYYVESSDRRLAFIELKEQVRVVKSLGFNPNRPPIEFSMRQLPELLEMIEAVFYRLQSEEEY